jgi:lauroyl/myristoyl acyltransferase
LKQGAGKSTLPRHPEDPAGPAMPDFLVYVLYRAGSAVAAALPLPFLFVFGQFLGACAWVCSGKYRRLAKRNLAIAFENEKSPRELRRLVRQHFLRLG